MCIYVDDMIYLGSSEILVDEFKLCTKKEFEMTNLGKLQYFLGLKVKQVEDGIFVSQRKYAGYLLLRFGMCNSKAVATPLQINKKLRLVDGTGLLNLFIGV